MQGIHTVCHLVKGALVTCPAYLYVFIQRCHAKKQKMRDRGFPEAFCSNTSSTEKSMPEAISSLKNPTSMQQSESPNSIDTQALVEVCLDTGIDENYPELQCSEILAHYRCVNLNVSVHSPMP